MGEDEAYPSQIIIKGFKLNLSYCFSPGTSDDGVSVEIPENMLSQFNDRDFDWLVPGYLEEKVLSTLKSLPKGIRRDLIPLNETAKSCSDQLLGCNQVGKSFTQELARELQKQSGKQLLESDFEMSKVASHLTMKYKSIGKKQVLPLLSLSNIKAAKSSVSKKASVSSDNKFKSWAFGHFLIEKQLTNKNQLSRVFQGLKDCNEYVLVDEFPSLQSAVDSHKQGVARLVLLQNSTLLNQFFNSWPEKKLLERLSIRFDGFRAVFNSLVLKWAVSLFDNQKLKGSVSVVELTDEAFNLLNNLFSTDFRKSISQQLTLLLPMIKQREQVFSAIAALKQNSYPDSIKDMKAQLNLLWCHNSLISSQSAPFDDYTRFQQGLIVRIKRIQSNYPKEQSAMETWLEWEGWWQELEVANEKLDLLPSLSELFWLLQEFRISLFSPGVKVKNSISGKKLQKLFEQIETQLSV